MRSTHASYFKVSCLIPIYFLYCSASKSPDQGHSNRRHTESLKPSSRSSPLPLPSPPSLGLVYALEADLEVSLLLKIGKQNWGGWLSALLDGLQAQPRASSVAILFFYKEDHRGRRFHKDTQFCLPHPDFCIS